MASRGYVRLSDHEDAVHVTCSANFRICIGARNIETSRGGIQVATQPSHFRGRGSSGPSDGLVLDVPAQTGMDLGCIDAQHGELVEISTAFGARVVVLLTVGTCAGATIQRTWN